MHAPPRQLGRGSPPATVHTHCAQPLVRLCATLPLAASAICACLPRHAAVLGALRQVIALRVMRATMAAASPGAERNRFAQPVDDADPRSRLEEDVVVATQMCCRTAVCNTHGCTVRSAKEALTPRIAHGRRLPIMPNELSMTLIAHRHRCDVKRSPTSRNWHAGSPCERTRLQARVSM
jgi:hypothetical protein